MKVKGEFEALAGFIERNRFTSGKALQAADTIYWMGEKPNYADYMLLVVLVVLKNATPKDGWARVTHWSGGKWAKFWNACEARGLLEVK